MNIIFIAEVVWGKLINTLGHQICLLLRKKAVWRENRGREAKRLADLAFKMVNLNIIDSESAFLNGEKTISLALSLVL